jgi:hypothetical protein
METNTMSAIDALELAMYLAVTAPTEQKSLECTDIAISIASEMDAHVVRACKSRVAKRLRDAN